MTTSLKDVGATAIADFFKRNRPSTPIEGAHPAEIAVIGSGAVRDDFGWSIPSEIKQLMVDAEERKPGRLLSWAGYEGLCVLADHPEAEKDE